MQDNDANKVPTTSADEGVSPDDEDRIEDFLARHGGAGRQARRWNEDGMRGWSEVYAADGYALRCDWSRTGSRRELVYSERAPGNAPERAPGSQTAPDAADRSHDTG